MSKVETTKTPCAIRGCEKPIYGRPSPWVGDKAVCKGHWYGPCSVCGVKNAKKMGRDGRPTCKPCFYGTCTAEGCTNNAGQIKDGQPVCKRHKYGDGACVIAGCHRVAAYPTPSGTVCFHHRTNKCAVEGCTAPTPDSNPLCYVHQARGADYVKGVGMRPDLPGLIYVVHHEGFTAIKPGIGIAHAGRVGQHLANGWTGILAIEEGLTIADVRVIEGKILAAHRAAGMPVGVLAEHMPQSGHTETAPGTRADALALAEWIKAGIRAGNFDAPVPLPAAYGAWV